MQAQRACVARPTLARVVDLADESPAACWGRAASVVRGGAFGRRVAGLAVVLAVGIGWLSGAPARAEGGVRTFLMGDSFAIGMAPTFGAHRTVAMIGGSVHYRWENVAGIDRGTRVVLVLGTNDSVETGLEGTANYGYRVREIARKLADRAREVVWVGPPCVLPGHMYIDDERLRDLAEVQRESVVGLGRSNLRWVSMRAMTQQDGVCLENGRTGDQVHFTAAGYARIVRAIRAAAGMRAR